MSLAESVKERARELGFAPVGITTADRFPADEARSLAWLEAGHQAGLGWMTPERQRLACRPDELLPGARSLIVVGASYASSTSEAGGAGSRSEKRRQPFCHPERSEGSPGLIWEILRYAQGDIGGRDGKRGAHDGDHHERHGDPHERRGDDYERHGDHRECRGDDPDASGLRDDTPRGRVARYARGADYHDVTKARLRELAAYVESLVGADGATPRTRVFVDSSPLVERAAAVRAGLGFIGKNTNLLTADAGSWLLLGAILTDLALEPDRPVLRDCGQCRLCLDACPTGALPAPYVLDANRCISYLTIEHKGSIPDNLRPLMGDHVFGCDICQEVCPWNRRTHVLPWPEFAGPSEAGAPSLPDLLTLDAEGFRGRYRCTPVSRTKRRGLLRNAAVALGNAGGSDDVPALGAALADVEPLVRGHAAWALGQIGGSEARRLLADALAVEQAGDVHAEIQSALDALCAREAAAPAPGP